MNLTLLCIIVAMGIAVVVLTKGLRYPRNVGVLFITVPMLMCISSTMTFIGGLLASRIAPDPKLATLPLTFMIIGTAIATLFIAKLNQAFSRKGATNIGFVLAICGALIASVAALFGQFYLLLLAALLMGSSLAFAQQLRFAAIESVSAEQAPNVLSALMLSGVFAAMLGPEVAFLGRNWLVSEHGYAGSFLGLSLVLCLAMVIFQWFQNPMVHHPHLEERQPRALWTIVKQPLFVIALMSGAIGYGLMSFIMTATPLSMHTMNGHSLEDTKWVIQSHVIAMFLPSIVTGWLIKRYSVLWVLVAGVIAYSLVAIIALSGQHVMHYWWALVLLGIGWNFLFISGTALLPQSYQSHERFKVQACNDFVIFSTQALASLLAGWLLFQTHWNMVVLLMVPLIIVMALVIICYYRISTRQAMVANH
ncbi:MFS transporter [Thalassotalea ponticola]|uniref:MFS transporter n=1 Tax=Thalassotalea ponticola TaxID=1523392 RepID=UPI0025B4688E|nr:MFS transporter [Thalassotalea ponticola]MDN3652294.1 MFS transporter [Thalassotalea ponticola]